MVQSPSGGPRVPSQDAETIKLQRAKNKEAMKMFW